MTPTPMFLRDLVTAAVSRDLRETVRFNLAMAGVAVIDRQLDGLVTAVVARPDGEFRLRLAANPPRGHHE